MGLSRELRGVSCFKFQFFRIAIGFSEAHRLDQPFDQSESRVSKIEI
jgi:hypothetical protein